MTPPPSRLPKILGWIAFAAVLLTLGPIAFAVVMLRSGPQSDGADPTAMVFIALLVLAASAVAGWLVQALGAAVRLIGRP